MAASLDHLLRVRERGAVVECEAEMNARIIQEVVAEHYGITHERLIGKLRIFVAVRARHVAMYLARTVLDDSYPSLGRAFRRDHTSVLDGYRRVEKLIKHDLSTKADVDLLLQKIANYTGATESSVCPTCQRPHEKNSVIAIRADMARLQERIDEMSKRGAA
jgi:hypothetical protein